MSCNCKEKNPETSQTPCADETEESYRQAFLRESRKTSKFCFERDTAKRELEITKGIAAKHLTSLDNSLAALDSWAQTLIERLPDIVANSPDIKRLVELKPQRLVIGK